VSELKSLVRHIARKVPAISDPIRSVRFFRRCRRQFGLFQREFKEAVYGSGPIEVLCGPFVGMRYFDKVVWGPITPKWIGSFEAELHGIVEEITSTSYNTIVDIGAAEGYYAVGLARALPQARIVTYDIDFIARRRQKSLAALNGLSKRVTVQRRCNHSKLQHDLREGRRLVISDVEGAEIELIDPESAISLKESDLLVECHSRETHSVDDVAAVLKSRFKATHQIDEILSRSRRALEWSPQHPRLRSIDDEMLSFAINEFRSYPQKWLWMRCQ
jgi:hypothetical protein